MHYVYVNSSYTSKKLENAHLQLFFIRNVCSSKGSHLKKHDMVVLMEFRVRLKVLLTRLTGVDSHFRTVWRG